MPCFCLTIRLFVRSNSSRIYNSYTKVLMICDRCSQMLSGETTLANTETASAPRLCTTRPTLTSQSGAGLSQASTVQSSNLNAQGELSEVMRMNSDGAELRAQNCAGFSVIARGSPIKFWCRPKWSCSRHPAPPMPCPFASIPCRLSEIVVLIG
jgi:hypothetical protein